MREKFKNRVHAGQLLADEIGKDYDNQKGDIIVLALPRYICNFFLLNIFTLFIITCNLCRGGVPVAFQISQRLRAPLDVFLVRKIGVEL